MTDCKEEIFAKFRGFHGWSDLTKFQNCVKRYAKILREDDDKLLSKILTEIVFNKHRELEIFTYFLDTLGMPCSDKHIEQFLECGSYDLFEEFVLEPRRPILNKQKCFDALLRFMETAESDEIRFPEMNTIDYFYSSDDDDEEIEKRGENWDLKHLAKKGEFKELREFYNSHGKSLQDLEGVVLQEFFRHDHVDMVKWFLSDEIGGEWSDDFIERCLKIGGVKVFKYFTEDLKKKPFELDECFEFALDFIKTPTDRSHYCVHEKNDLECHCRAFNAWRNCHSWR